jgi:hypothetical protein
MIAAAVQDSFLGVWDGFCWICRHAALENGAGIELALDTVGGVF